MKANFSMILLDEGEKWDGEGEVVVYWSQLSPSSFRDSIPQKVQEQSANIKKEYLAWLFRLGKTKVGNKTLIEFLKIFDNFSFWWMTRVAEKSPLKSPCIYQVFKLRALELLYLEKNCRGLLYFGNDLKLHNILKAWCRELGHSYRRVSSKKCEVKSKEAGLRGIVSRFPHCFQALNFLLYLWYKRFRHLRSPLQEKPQSSPANEVVTLVTFFPNIDMKKAKSGIFWSHYWGKLHDLLNEVSTRVRWIWLYTDSNQFSYADSVSLKNHFDVASSDKFRHFLLEEFLSKKEISKSLKLYFDIFIKGLCLSGIKKEFCFSGSKLNFFPYLEGDWKSSFFGKSAMEGALQVRAFESMTKKFLVNSWSIFNWESQPWELALVSAWQRNRGEDKIYGYQHSAVIAQDLRPFLDHRIYEQNGVEAYPLPEKLVTNSPYWENLISDYDYPKDKIVLAEALRYLYLQGSYEKEKRNIKALARVLLVVTGIDRLETQRQLQLLFEANNSGGLKKYEKIIIKPHPDLSVQEFLIDCDLNCNFYIASKQLKELWSEVDVVYCANSTSVSIEAAYLGVPLIIAGPMNNINLSPLSYDSSVKFVGESSELCEQLDEPDRIPMSETLFHLDEELILWRSFIKSVEQDLKE